MTRLHLKAIALLTVFVVCFSIPNNVYADDTGIPHTHNDNRNIQAEREMRKAQRRVERRQEREAKKEARQRQFGSNNTTAEPKKAVRNLNIGRSNGSNTAKQPPKSQKKRYTYRKSSPKRSTGGTLWVR